MHDRLLNAPSAAQPISTGKILLVAAGILFAIVVGYLAGDNVLIAIAATSAIIGLSAFFGMPGSLFFKFAFALMALRMSQGWVGFMNVESVRGVNVANILILGLLATWFYAATARRNFYEPRSIDVPLIIAVVLLPIGSFLYTHAFLDMPGYSLTGILSYYKRWVTPFMCVFLMVQCMKDRREMRWLIVGLLLIAFGSACASLLEFAVSGSKSLEEGARSQYRTEGVISEPNIYSCFLNQVIPFGLLVIFLYRGHLGRQFACFVLVAILGATLITTFSRAGYLGFLVVAAVSMYIGFRSGGHIPIVGPTFLASIFAGIVFLISPNMVDTISERFSPKTYDKNVRTSETLFQKLNNYSGDRLHLWDNAYQMWKESPVFGVGYRTYILRIARMHRKGHANSPHSQYMGMLAEGGVVGLAALLFLYWKLLAVLYRGWRAAVRLGDRFGQVICGGGTASFISMLWMGLTLDFLHPSGNTIAFWLPIGACLAYSYSLLDELKQRGPDFQASHPGSPDSDSSESPDHGTPDRGTPVVVTG